MVFSFFFLSINEYWTPTRLAMLQIPSTRAYVVRLYIYYAYIFVVDTIMLLSLRYTTCRMIIIIIIIISTIVIICFILFEIEPSNDDDDGKRLIVWDPCALLLVIWSPIWIFSSLTSLLTTLPRFILHPLHLRLRAQP